MEITNNLNIFFVFIGGFLSFFSPCVLPLIPLYISYLSGNTLAYDKDGNISFDKRKVIINTIFFILGISASFFILALSFSVIGEFFFKNKYYFTIISSIIILFLGLYQLDIIKISFLEKEKKIDAPSFTKMNIFIAFILGFTFSFAWTPCVGPMLSSILLYANTLPKVYTNLLIFTYALGFLIPFLLLGFFTTTFLNFFKKNQKFSIYFKKIAGVILIILALFTFFNTNIDSSDINIKENNVSEATKDDKMYVNFELEDQNGQIHRLSDYKGKVVFLNFWATWCGYCQKELEDLKEIFIERGMNKDDIIILSMVNPKTEKSLAAADEDENYIKEFIEDKNINFPVLFDKTGEEFYKFRIQAFPTSFVINRDGTIEGYVNGALIKDDINEILDKVSQKK